MSGLRTFVPLCLVTAALSGCGGEDRGRPEAGPRPPPGPGLEDPGSGPFRCDQDAGLELELLEDFEWGAAAGAWYTNNETCELCQKLIDLRVGAYDTAGSLERTVMKLAGDAAPADIDLELERLVVRLDWMLTEPRWKGIEPMVRGWRATLALQLERDLTSADWADLSAILTSITDEVIAAAAECRTPCEVTQTPTPVFVKPVPAEVIPGAGRCGSRYALRVQAGPLTAWGGTIGTRFGPPLDGKSWDGFAFWARVGPGSRTPVRVEMSDRHTDEKFDEGAGPYCNPIHTDDTDETGCDKFGLNVQLNQDWQLVLIPFEEVRQRGWGRRAPYFDLGAIPSLSWQFERGTWDIWLDDVALYRRTTP